MHSSLKSLLAFFTFSLLIVSCAAPYEITREGYTRESLMQGNDFCYVLVLDEKSVTEIPVDSVKKGKFIIRSKYNECDFELVEPEVKNEACGLGANVALIDFNATSTDCSYTVSFYLVQPKNLDIATLIAVEREFASIDNRTSNSKTGRLGAGGIVLSSLVGVISFLIMASLVSG